jgi:hypothetical protein
VNRERFEQLVSQWLDQPDDDELRARIEAAVASSPGFGRLKGEWIALDHLVRQATSTAVAADWARLREHIARGLSNGGGQDRATEAALDGLLRSRTAVEQRVDWDRYGRRVAAAAAGRATVIRFTRRRVAAGVGLVAAAAAVVLLLLVPPETPPPTPGLVSSSVSPVAITSIEQQTGVAFASLTELPAGEDRGGPGVEGTGGSKADSGEIFLVIAPAARRDTAAGLLGMFGPS